jgi:hypothetical protein
VRNAHLDLGLKGLHGLRVGERQALLDDLVHRTVGVRAGGVAQVKKASKKARSLGATSTSQRQKLSWERQRASGRA